MALRGASSVLCLGIGGGGDVIGALATRELAVALGTSAIVGGVTWERRVVDPRPGPRTLAEIEGIEPLSEAVALAGPETRGPGGFAFAEARMAGVLGERTVLVDPTPGPRVVGASVAQAARRLGCDLVVLIDVGGDVLANGDEPGLASPLCDAVMLAASEAVAADGIEVVAGVFGAGCDGELTPDEVLERIAVLAAAGGLLGAWGITPQNAARLEEAVAAIPTEASAQALRCARGERGTATIRGGERTVLLSPVGALTFYFDPAVAIGTVARLAAEVRDAASLAAADERLHRLGLTTEFDLERRSTAA